MRKHWNLKAESKKEGDDFLKDSGEEMQILYISRKSNNKTNNFTLMN